MHKVPLISRNQEFEKWLALLLLESIQPILNKETALNDTTECKIFCKESGALHSGAVMSRQGQGDIIVYTLPHYFEELRKPGTCLGYADLVLALKVLGLNAVLQRDNV